MKARCPYCGYEEDVPNDNYGNMVDCPCGQSFVVGQVQVPKAAFVQGDAVVKCPYCEGENKVPKEAISRDVRCGKCNGKFHIVIKGTRAETAGAPTRSGALKMNGGAHSGVGQKDYAQPQRPFRPVCEYLNLECARSATTILLVVSVLACAVWAIYAVSLGFRFKGSVGFWDLAIAVGLPLLTAVATYVSLALAAAVFEIAKNLRRLYNEVLQLRQDWK